MTSKSKAVTKDHDCMQNRNNHERAEKNVCYQLYLEAEEELTGQLLFTAFGRRETLSNLLSLILIFSIHIAEGEEQICVGRLGDRINIIRNHFPCWPEF